MKKIYNIIIVLMILFSISTLAIADDKGKHYGKDNNPGGNQTGVNDQNETDDNETVDGPMDSETGKEIRIMNNSLGAEIRLLQLEKAITKNILIGNMTIEVLKGLDLNTTTLERIIDEMKIVLEYVKAANTSANDSVQIFVELKNESKNLTRQFRETVKGLLTDEKIQEIKQRIKEIVNESLQDLTHLIKIKIRQFNRNQIYRLYGIIGETNSTFINGYINESINLSQVKLQICKMINQMTKDQKYDVFSEIKEDNIKRNIHSRDNFEHHGGNK
jgi:hypothetical protein